MDLGRDRRDGAVAFVFRQVDDAERIALRALYPQGGDVEDGYATEYPDDLPDLDLAFEHLRRSIDDMVAQQLGRTSVPWSATLRGFLARVNETGVDWGLIGGAALAVRGVQVAPGDVDVVTDPEGARRISELFSDSIVDPTYEIAQFGWFGRAFTGARLEWLGNERGITYAWSLSAPLQPCSWVSGVTELTHLRPSASRN